MSSCVELKPGRTPLVQWRAIYRGAAVSLDPFARPDVDAGSAALADLCAREAAPPLPEAEAPALAELMESGGDRLPSPLVRLFVTLKLASLAQGFSGMRWETLTGIGDFLAAGLLPAVPAEDVNDRSALARLFAALTGMGEVVRGDERLAATKALKDAARVPLKLEPPERSALLSGTALSTATALAGLFEAERVFRSALVATALSATAMRDSTTPLHPRALELRRQPSAIEVAESLNALAPTAISGRSPSDNAPDMEASILRAAPLELGARLDCLRQAGVTLEQVANAVTEERLVVWQSGEMIAGVEDRSAAEGAADLVAFALIRIAALSHARIARLWASNASDSDAAPTSPADRAASFLERIRALAEPGAEARPLLAMSGMVALVLSIELLEAARACENEDCPAALGGVLRLVRDAAPQADADPSPAALAAIAEGVGSGAFAAAVDVSLPGVAPCPPSSR